MCTNHQVKLNRIVCRINMTHVLGRIENVDKLTWFNLNQSINYFDKTHLSYTQYDLPEVDLWDAHALRMRKVRYYLFFSSDLTSDELDRLGLLTIRLSSGILDMLENSGSRWAWMGMNWQWPQSDVACEPHEFVIFVINKRNNVMWTGSDVKIQPHSTDWRCSFLAQCA